MAWVRTEAKRCATCGVHPFDVDDFLEHFEVDLERCRICEKRDAFAHDVKGQTGNAFGQKFAWVRKLLR